MMYEIKRGVSTNRKAQTCESIGVCVDARERYMRIMVGKLLIYGSKVLAMGTPRGIKLDEGWLIVGDVGV